MSGESLSREPYPRERLSPEQLSQLALSLSFGPGSTIPVRLLELFGSAEAVWAEEPFSLAFKTGLQEKRAAFLHKRAYFHDLARRRAEEAAAAGVGMLLYSDAEYPALLRHIHNPPMLLYFRGDSSLLSGRCLAVVGTRHASAEAMVRSRRLGRVEAATGRVVVSGLARGVDAAAHRGALDIPNGRTAAVLGCGIDVLYPVSNADLREAIIRRGVVISEFPPEQEPRRAYFPMRNRLISGLSQSVVVVEAPTRSGALITAQAALEQGREVLVCGWERRTARNRGVFRLLEDGALLYREKLDPVKVPVAAGRLPAVQKRLLRFLAGKPASLSGLLAEFRLAPDALIPELVRLELQGRVRFRDGLWWMAEMAVF